MHLEMNLTHHHTTTDKIEQSRMAYRLGWLNAREECSPFAVLEPSHLLLLCLNSSAFGRVEPAVLCTICKDLRLDKMVKDAIHQWGFEEMCPMVGELYTGLAIARSLSVPKPQPLFHRLSPTIPISCCTMPSFSSP